MATPSTSPQTALLLVAQIGRLRALFQDVAQESLQGSGVTFGEFVALVMVDGAEGDLTQTAWGEMQGVSRQRAHTLSKRLAKLGLLKVTLHGRASTVSLTRKGKRLLVSRRPNLGSALAASMQGMDEAQVRQLVGLLWGMLDAVDPQG